MTDARRALVNNVDNPIILDQVRASGACFRDRRDLRVSVLLHTGGRLCTVPFEGHRIRCSL